VCIKISKNCKQLTDLNSNAWRIGAVPQWYSEQTELCRQWLVRPRAAYTYHTATWYRHTPLLYSSDYYTIVQ